MLKRKANVSFVIIAIWVIAVGIKKDIEEHLTGSWTDFNGQVTEQTNVRKCFLQYLPPIPRPLYQQYFYSIYQPYLSLQEIFRRTIESNET